MSNQVTGKIYKKLPVQMGAGKNGQWIKNEFVIETEEQYPKKICCGAWGNLATDMDRYAIGDLVTVHFNVESKEYNDRWYTEVRAWKIEVDAMNQDVQTRAKPEKKQEVKEEAQNTFTNNDEGDDLPF